MFRGGILLFCRFIPDDMTFDHDAKSVATSLPDDYKATLFTNSALQCSSVYFAFLHISVFKSVSFAV